MPVIVSLLLLILQQDSYEPARLVSAGSPSVPLESIYGGEVIVDALVDSGGALREARLIQGSPPFADPALSAVSQWRFSPAELAEEPLDSRVSVTVLFRPRAIFSTGAPPPSVPASVLDADHAPFPLAISVPGYPANSLAEGVVILALRIGPNGAIEDLQVVQDVPPLAGPAELAVRSWSFLPATRGGQPVPGTAVVAISFLRPVV